MIGLIPWHTWECIEPECQPAYSLSLYSTLQLAPVTRALILHCSVPRRSTTQSSSTAPKKDAALRAPAPLALLRGPIQYYQSDECLGFSIFVFHCFLSREPSGQEGAVVLQVLHDYMSCCSTDAVMRNAGVCFPQFLTLPVPLALLIPTGHLSVGMPPPPFLLENVDLRPLLATLCPPSVALQTPSVTLQPPLVALQVLPHVQIGWLGITQYHPVRCRLCDLVLSVEVILGKGGRVQFSVGRWCLWALVCCGLGLICARLRRSAQCMQIDPLQPLKRNRT